MAFDEEIDGRANELALGAFCLGGGILAGGDLRLCDCRLFPRRGNLDLRPGSDREAAVAGSQVVVIKAEAPVIAIGDPQHQAWHDDVAIFIALAGLGRFQAANHRVGKPSLRHQRRLFGSARGDTRGEIRGEICTRLVLTMQDRICAFGAEKQV